MFKSSQSVLCSILNDFRVQCWFCSWGSSAVHKALGQCSCSVWCQKRNPLSEWYVFVFMPGHLITLRFLFSPVASSSWHIFELCAALFFSNTHISVKDKVPGLKCVWHCDSMKSVKSSVSFLLILITVYDSLCYFSFRCWKHLLKWVKFSETECSFPFTKIFKRILFCPSEALHCLKHSTSKWAALNFLSLLSCPK